MSVKEKMLNNREYCSRHNFFYPVNKSCKYCESAQYVQNVQILVNGFSALQAFKLWLLREKYRHQQDIDAIDKDLSLLEDIEIPPGVDLAAWYKIDREKP